MTEPGEPILQLRGVNKSFGAVQVLHDVDLKIYPGQVTALVGDNGAGKSTLVKCVAGIHGIDTGEYLFEGKPVTVHSPRDAAALGIEIVYQDLALCDNLDIVQNMFLGREPKSGLVLDEAQMEIKARDTLASPVGAHRHRVCGNWSPACPAGSGRRWPSPSPCCGTPRSSCSTSRPPRWASPRPGRSSIWSAASPTTASACCLISHNMNDVKEVSDRISALYLGRVAADVPASEVTTGQIVELITTGRSGEHGLAQSVAEKSA